MSSIKNKVELRYAKNATHPSYYFEGKRLSSVTTIISGNSGWNKNMLLSWYAKKFRAGRDPEEKRDRAADVGTLVHTAIEHMIYGAEGDMDLSNVDVENIAIIKQALTDFNTWMYDKKVTWLESEVSLASPTLLTAGTVDAVADINGVTTLIDFKTSSGIYAEHIVQLGAYRALIQENMEYHIDRCIIIHIDKSEGGKVNFVDIPNELVDLGEDDFELLSRLHQDNKKFSKWLRKLKKKK